MKQDKKNYSGNSKEVEGLVNRKVPFEHSEVISRRLGSRHLPPSHPHKKNEARWEVHKEPSHLAFSYIRIRQINLSLQISVVCGLSNLCDLIHTQTPERCYIIIPNIDGLCALQDLLDRLVCIGLDVGEQSCDSVRL